MLSSEGPGRSFRHNVLLAIFLCSVAGAVNASGFFVLGVHTSHMTGTASALGEAWGSGNFAGAWTAARLLLSFFLGAAASTALLEASRGRRRGRYAPALLLEAFILASAGLWSASAPGSQLPVLSWLIAFSMGMQNALVTRISSAVVRTTHLTGVITDLGMELVHLLSWLQAHYMRSGALGLWRALLGVGRAAEFERAWLHLSIVVSFLCGAVVGPLMCQRAGGLALGLPGTVLVGLAARDIWPRQRPVSTAAPSA
jgi:uncharacterized membrane protein YoaK (UPF0700 family)